MNSMLFKEFAVDVEALYYKLRLSSIEDCFIRLSQASQKVDAIDFTRWLNSERKSKNKNSIYRQITVPELLDTFNYLYSLIARVRSIESDLGKFRTEIFNQNPKIIEIINTMNIFLSDYSVNSILLPFQVIIQLVCKVFPMSPYNEEMIKKDLQIIAYAYNDRLTEQRESLKNLFPVLLNRFSQDVGRSLIEVGRKDLADKVTSEKILFRPDLLSQILPIGNVSYVMGDKINDMLSHVLYGDRNPDDVYEYIKKEALDFVGAIDKKQYDQQLGAEKIQEDTERLQKGEELQAAKPKSIDVTAYQWLHPRSLGILSATLYALYRKISKQ